MSLLNNGSGAILSFGELLLRICPDVNGDWLTANNLPVYVGGAELNVATALALWQLPSRYFTALPDNDMSRQVLNYLDEKMIDTSPVYFHGDRIGLYFLTQGQDLKNNALIYDRAGSSFASLKTGMIDWDKVYEDVSWFHFSAICPAISQTVADVCEEAIAEASKRGITVSIDLNYRAKLWKYGKQPAEVMKALLPYCDQVMGNIWAAQTMLDIPVPTNINEQSTKADYQAAARQTSKEIIKQYPKCKAVANTFRFDTTDGGLTYYTTLYNGEDLITSAQYSALDIVDKVGSGDCFMAGLIYGYYQQLAEKDILAYATAAAFQKLFIKSDATNKTVAEIKNSIKHE
jgi:2-dehydro-3-deoxygluconokinase